MTADPFTVAFIGDLLADVSDAIRNRQYAEAQTLLTEARELLAGTDRP